MPPKTPEPMREQVLSLKRAGRSYNQIKAETKLSRPAIWKILKEAGLVGQAPPASSPSVAPPSMQPTAPVLRPSTSGNGLDEFQPPAPPSKPKAKPTPQAPAAPESVEYGDCSECGTTHRLVNGEKLERCLACGAIFD